MKDETNSAWIDDVIKQHKKQLEELKRCKEQTEDNIFLIEKSKERINPNYSTSLNTPVPLPLNKSSMQNSIKLQQQQQQQQQQQLTIDPTKLKAKINELTIKLTQKKEKIHTLKQQNTSLINENEELKSHISQMTNQINNNIFNQSETQTISQLQQRIKDLESALENSEIKINQMTVIKNKEFDLMNQKIKDFEVIIDENSSNYISNMNKLNKAIEDYKLRIIEADKYVHVVNFFIQKIDSLCGNEQREIYDYKELQSKLVGIEKIIMNSSNNLLCLNTNMKEGNSVKPLPLFQNKVLKSISGMNPNAVDDGSNRGGGGYEDSKLQDEDLYDVEHYERDKGFEVDIKAEAEKNSIQYKTLEERVNELENELRRKPLSSVRKKTKDKENSNNDLSKERSKSKGIRPNELKTEISNTHIKKVKKKKKKKAKCINNDHD